MGQAMRPIIAADNIDDNERACEGEAQRHDGLPAISGERRANPRKSMLLRSAKLLVGSREYLCVIRDVSESGLSIRVFHPLPEDADLHLVMGNGDRHRLRTVRREPLLIACEFITPPDVSRIVTEPSRFCRRQTRLNVKMPGAVEGDFGCEMVMITNLSQQGARVECERRLPVHGKVCLGANGLPDIHARVCWSHSRAAGLVFYEYFRFEEFAQLVAEI